MCMLFTSVISCRGMALCASSVAFPRQDNSWTCSQKMWQLDATSNSHPLEPVYGTWFVDLPQYIYYIYIYFLYTSINQICLYTHVDAFAHRDVSSMDLGPQSFQKLRRKDLTKHLQLKVLSQFPSFLVIPPSSFKWMLPVSLVQNYYTSMKLPLTFLLICDLRWLEDRRCWAVIRHVPSPQKKVGF